MLEKLRPAVVKITNDPALTFQLKLQGICDLLHKNVDRYDWVGFYMADIEKKELHLKAKTGADTEHTTIPFGKGICGQVAVSGENFTVPDVAAQDNYISCGIDVRSEVVVPFLKNGKNIGQIDIDSHSPNAFDKDDEDFLVFVNAKLAEQL